MKSKIMTISLLACTLSLITATTIKAETNNQANTTGTASTYQAGPWQPVARFDNPQGFVRVQILNKTKTPLQYSLSTGDALNTQIPVGGIANLTTNSLPSYVLIYDQNQSPLKYNVTAQGNSAIVTVEQASTTTGAGDTTLNLQQSGGIYVY
ncbi:MAG: hypothetical protein ACR9NN_10110 [Nostochopsis sp.]